MKKTISFYDNLYGYICVDGKFTDIINDPFLSRLHRISQMGMARYIFPDAVHTRFSHSLGVFHNVSRLFLSQGEQFDDVYSLPSKQEETLQLTALLHDVGHVPLSHTTEQAMKRYHDDVMQDDSLVGLGEQEEQYKNNDTKLHERLAEAILLGPTSLNILVTKLGYSCSEISYGIMGFQEGRGFEELGTLEPVALYLKHARNFMHSQLDADRIDYLIRDSAFSGVKAGAFDVEKLLREVRYDAEANYGVDEEGIRALEQFFFARFGAYSQIVFNKKVHGLEYLAQEFYYQLLIEKEQGHINDSMQNKIFTFEELEEALRSGDCQHFLSFTDNVFFELVERAIDGTLISPSPRLKKIAEHLKKGLAPKVVGYEEYFATEEENRFHNSFFDYLRNPENLQELSERSGVPLDDMLLPEGPLRTTLIDSDKDRLCVFRDNKKKAESLLDCDNSLLKLLKEKQLYLDRLFTFDEASQKKLKQACSEMSKGFSSPGDFGM